MLKKLINLFCDRKKKSFDIIKDQEEIKASQFTVNELPEYNAEETSNFTIQSIVYYYIELIDEKTFTSKQVYESIKSNGYPFTKKQVWKAISKLSKKNIIHRVVLSSEFETPYYEIDRSFMKRKAKRHDKKRTI